MSKASEFILRLYFAVIAAVTLFTLMFGTIDLLSMGLKTYVFTAADVPNYIENCSSPYKRAPLDAVYDEQTEFENCKLRNESTKENYKHEKASDSVRNFSLIIVSLPLFLLHFGVLYRDWKDTRVESKKKK